MIFHATRYTRPPKIFNFGPSEHSMPPREKNRDFLINKKIIFYNFFIKKKYFLYFFSVKMMYKIIFTTIA